MDQTFMKKSKLFILLFLLSFSAFAEEPFAAMRAKETWNVWVVSGGWHYRGPKENDNAFTLGVKNFIYNLSFKEVSSRWAGIGVNVDHKGRASLSLSPFATAYHTLTLGPELNLSTDGHPRVGLFLGWSF